jgi:two-component system, OmpR family, response regulator ChvI
VRAWECGEDFLTAMATGGRPNLLLLDCKMPGLNSIEVLRRMRAAGIDPPVIFLTVLSDRIFEEAALLGGAVDFVEKSCSLTILERRLGPEKGAYRTCGRLAGPAKLSADFTVPRE